MGYDYNPETMLAHLKTPRPMAVLRCKTASGVLKELTVFALVYNLIRLAICRSAMLHHLGVVRVVFGDAL